MFIMFRILLGLLGIVKAQQHTIGKYPLDYDFQILPQVADWYTAQDVCKLDQGILLPELGNYLLESGIFDSFGRRELVWLNAKNIVIRYGDTSSVNLTISYRPANLELTSFLCINAKSSEMRRNVSCQPLSWAEAKNVCQSDANSELLNVTTPEQLKRTIYMFKHGVTFWVDEHQKHMLPTMVSSGFSMTEECWGMMQHSDGSLAYRKENCSKRHKFVCASKNADDQFAPTVTKTPRPTPRPVFKWKTQKIVHDVSGAVGGYMGVIIFGVILVLAGLGVGYYFRERWWRMKSSTTFMNKQRITVRQGTSSGHQSVDQITSAPNFMQPQQQPGLRVTLWGREDLIQCQ